MHERAQDAAAVEAVQMRAGLAEATAPAGRAAEREREADERVEVGAADDDVAAVVGRPLGEGSSRTAASTSVSAEPGRPEANVPRPAS